MNKKIVIVGACSELGCEAVRYFHEKKGYVVVGAVDKGHDMADIGTIALHGSIGVRVSEDIFGVVKRSYPDIILDVAGDATAYQNAINYLSLKTPAVIHADGLSKKSIQEIENTCKQVSGSIFIAPDFSVGRYLLTQFATVAAKYFNTAQIIEMHEKETSSTTALDLVAKMEENTRCEVGLQSIPVFGYGQCKVCLTSEGQRLEIVSDATNLRAEISGMHLALDTVLSARKFYYGLGSIIKNC